jgi:hypothetical protein
MSDLKHYEVVVQCRVVVVVMCESEEEARNEAWSHGVGDRCDMRVRLLASEDEAEAAARHADEVV